MTLYTPNADVEQMFQRPRHVIKAGQLIVENGELRREVFGKTLHVAAGHFDPALEPHIADWFNDHYSIRFRNYTVDESYLGENQFVACR